MVDLETGKDYDFGKCTSTGRARGSDPWTSCHLDQATVEKMQKCEQDNYINATRDFLLMLSKQHISYERAKQVNEIFGKGGAE